MERSEKPKVKKVNVRGNPFKRYQVTSQIRVRLDDANEVPPTLPDGTLLLKERPPNAQHPTGASYLPDVQVRED